MNLHAGAGFPGTARVLHRTMDHEDIVFLEPFCGTGGEAHLPFLLTATTVRKSADPSRVSLKVRPARGDPGRMARETQRAELIPCLGGAGHAVLCLLIGPGQKPKPSKDYKGDATDDDRPRDRGEVKYPKGNQSGVLRAPSPGYWAESKFP